MPVRRGGGGRARPLLAALGPSGFRGSEASRLLELCREQPGRYFVLEDWLVWWQPLTEGGALPAWADVGNLSELLLDVDAPVELGIGPHPGYRYHVLERWHVSGSYHVAQRVELGARYTFLLPHAIEEASSLRFVLDDLPGAGLTRHRVCDPGGPRSSADARGHGAARPLVVVSRSPR